MGLIVFVLMGALNGTILGGVWVAFVMVKDGVIFDCVGRIDEGCQVFKIVLVFQVVFVSVFVLIGTFE